MDFYLQFLPDFVFAAVLCICALVNIAFIVFKTPFTS
jgi:hypothetical protein